MPRIKEMRFNFPAATILFETILVESRRSVSIRAGFCKRLHSFSLLHPSHPSITTFKIKMTEFSSTPVNAVLGDWSRFQYELPPFADLKPCDFEEALKTAMKQHIGNFVN